MPPGWQVGFTPCFYAFCVVYECEYAVGFSGCGVDEQEWGASGEGVYHAFGYNVFEVYVVAGGEGCHSVVGEYDDVYFIGNG